jgi:precorrin-2/cobalt-factor-2 C20-methyltransferase
MTSGTLYGIGIGPGDPELITLKGARLISACRNLFVPKARTASESVALAIARPLVGPETRIEEIVFPMTADREELAEKWDAAAARVATILVAGEDACFLTLGDPLLYSTYIHLMRALRRIIPDLKAITVPGIPAFGAAAALADFPVGEGREPVTIVPAADDLTAVRRALTAGGTVVLMKIGKRLPELLNLLDGEGLLESSVFVSHATMAGQRIETDLRRLKAEGPEAGYLSIILVHAGQKRLEEGYRAAAKESIALTREFAKMISLDSPLK